MKTNYRRQRQGAKRDAHKPSTSTQRNHSEAIARRYRKRLVTRVNRRGGDGFGIGGVLGRHPRNFIGPLEDDE